MDQSERHITTLADIENDSLLDRVVAIRDKATTEAEDIENIINLTKSIMTELNSITSDLDTYQTEFNSLGSRVKINFPNYCNFRRKVTNLAWLFVR